MESSRRDLLKYMAEQRLILKNNQITYHPRFGFSPKTGIPLPNKWGLCFYCESILKYPNLKLKMRLSSRLVGEWLIPDKTDLCLLPSYSPP